MHNREATLDHHRIQLRWVRPIFEAYCVMKRSIEGHEGSTKPNKPRVWNCLLGTPWNMSSGRLVSAETAC